MERVADETGRSRWQAWTQSGGKSQAPQLPRETPGTHQGSWVPGLTGRGHHADNDGRGGARALHHDGHQHPDHQPRHGVRHNRVVAEELPGHFSWKNQTHGHPVGLSGHRVLSSPARAHAGCGVGSRLPVLLAPMASYFLVSSQCCPNPRRHASPIPTPSSSYPFTLHPPILQPLCQQALLQPCDHELGLTCVLGPWVPVNLLVS